MLFLILTATVVFLAQVAAYRYFACRAAYRSRVAGLRTTTYVQRKPTPHAHNRPGDN